MKLTDFVPPILQRNKATTGSAGHYGVPWFGGGGFSPFSGFGLISGDNGYEYTEVSEYEAMTATAVYACVQVIASAIGTLPIHVRDRETNAIIANHHVARVLRNPNDDMTRSDLIEAWCLNLLTAGNGHLYTTRDNNFEPTALYPVRGQSCRCVRKNGRTRHTVTLNGKTFTAPIGSIVHAKNFSWDGLNGISPLYCGGKAVGLSLALQNFAVKFFQNNASVGNVIELPPMDPKVHAEFKRMWQAEYEGIENAHRTAAAPGLKVHKMGFSPKDSQADEQRLFQLREVARIYQVPPHKIGDLEKTTVGNGEEQARQFAQGTLRRWVCKMEEALEKTLLREDERDTLKIRFNLDALVRGSFRERVEALSKATGGAPIMMVDEARDHLDLQPVPGGDTLMANLNQQAADQRNALLHGVVQRMATQEVNALTRAAKKHAGSPDELRAWAKDWFPKQELRLRQALDGSGVEGQQIADYVQYRSQILESDASPASIESMIAQTADVLTSRIMSPPAGPGSDLESHENE